MLRALLIGSDVLDFNYVDIIFIAFFVILVFAGYVRGFAKSAFSLVKFIVIFPTGFYVSGTYSEEVYNTLFRGLISNKIAEEIANSTLVDLIDSVEEFVAGLPDFLGSAVDLSFLDVSTEDLENSIMTNVVDPICIVFVKCLLFILTIVLLYAITWLITHFVKSALKKKGKVLESTNKFLGAVFGAVKGILASFVISAIFYGVATLSSNSTSDFVAEINNSAIYNFVTDFNPIIKFITGV